jgi:C4-dicarboxylate-specific signal transduction histidine kinase
LIYRQTIRWQLAAATILLLLPLSLAIVWSSRRTYAEQQSEVGRAAAAIAVLAAAQLEQYLTGLDAMASAVTRHPVVMSLERERVDRFFADLHKSQPLVTNFILTTPDGRVLAAAVPLPTRLDRVTWGYIGEVVRRNHPYATNFLTSEISGKPIVMLGYPVRDEHREVAGVLGLGIDLVKLQEIFANTPLPPGSLVLVTDREGRVIALNRDVDRFIGKFAEIAPAALGARPDVSVQTFLDGVPRLAAELSVRNGSWTLTAGIPTTFVVDRLRPMWRRNSTIIIGAFVALISLGMVIAWQTRLHLNRLRDAAERMAGGDLSPMHRIQTPNLEFGQLQDTFIAMAINLRDARDALARQMDHERKMSETLQSLQRQVVRQERLAAVGLLVSGVAHEVSNPLQAVLGATELLERNPATPPELIGDIGFLKMQAGRAREIIRNLSRFSSQQTGPPSSISLADLIREVVQLRKRDAAAAGITLDVETATDRQVYANFTEIEQVALNFVINAQQALEAAGKRGRILIRLLDAGPRVRLEVLDNGPGVDPGDEAKLFQPFFTTKPVGQGTGLGLSVSYGIIHSSGGLIGYSRNDWGGATFYFELPADGVREPPKSS